MAVAGPKIPVVVATGILCFAAGAGVGVLAMIGFGYTWQEPGSETPVGPPPGPPMNAAAMLATRPKNQLVSLVTKLDQLTGKPLALHFTEAQRTTILEQLRDLDKKEISDEEAQKRLTALLGVVKGQRDTLEAAGYRWPGKGAGPPPSSYLNPFVQEQNARHLRSLREQLGKAGSQ
jgi:hypothetical protein